MNRTAKQPERARSFHVAYEGTDRSIKEPGTSRSVWSAKVLFRFLTDLGNTKPKRAYLVATRSVWSAKVLFRFLTDLGNTKPKCAYLVATRSVWSAKVLFRFCVASESTNRSIIGYAQAPRCSRLFCATAPALRGYAKAKEDFRTPNAPRSHRMCTLGVSISEVCEKAKEDFLYFQTLRDVPGDPG